MRISLKSLAFPVMMAAALTASAITVDDLDNSLVLQAFQGNLLYSNHFNYNTYGIFHKVEGEENLLLLDNFYDQPAYFILDSDGRLTLRGSNSAAGQTSLAKDGQEQTMQLSTIQMAQVGSTMYYCWDPFAEGDIPASGFSGTFREGNHLKSEDFDYMVNLCVSDEAANQDCLMFRRHVDSDRQGVSSLPEEDREKIRDERRASMMADYQRTFRAARLYVFKNYTYEAFTEESDIPVVTRVKKRDGLYYILYYNIGGYGWHYYFGGDQDYVDGGYYSASYNPETGDIDFPVVPLGSRTELVTEFASATTTRLVRNIHATVCSYVIGNQDENQKPFNGKYIPATPHHEEACENFWHPSVGGDLVTTETATLSIEPFSFRFQDGPQISTLVKNFPESTIRFDADVTHDVLLTVDSQKQSGSTLLVKGSLAPVIHEKYVEGYDIMYLPGELTTISEGQTDLETGLKGAKIIAAVSPEDLSFDVSHSLTEEVASRTASEGFNLFVRTRYTAESALRPSFHSLQLFTRRIVSGLETTLKDAVVAVHPVEGGLETADATVVTVYTPEGRLVASGATGLIPLPAGVYIVSSPGTAPCRAIVR